MCLRTVFEMFWSEPQHAQDYPDNLGCRKGPAPSRVFLYILQDSQQKCFDDCLCSVFYMNKSSKTADCRGSLKTKRLRWTEWISLCKSKLCSTQACGKEEVYWISAFEFILCCGSLFLRLMVVVQISSSEVPKPVWFAATYTPCVLMWLSKIWGSHLLCPARAKFTRQDRKRHLVFGEMWNSVIRWCFCSDGLQLENNMWKRKKNADTRECDTNTGKVSWN